MAPHIAYLNHRLCPQILQRILAEGSVFQVLRSEYGLRLTQAKEHVRRPGRSARDGAAEPCTFHRCAAHRVHGTLRHR
ncbi:MAG: UTRA domain-containing protein [Anaerolineae bacterium]